MTVQHLHLSFVVVLVMASIAVFLIKPLKQGKGFRNLDLEIREGGQIIIIIRLRTAALHFTVNHQVGHCLQEICPLKSTLQFDTIWHLKLTHVVLACMHAARVHEQLTSNTRLHRAVN